MTGSELEIVLDGGIQRSNFDEVRRDLIARIQEVQTELVTDQDFAQAEAQSKSLKADETALKKAKQSAIRQVASIHALFDAIDEIAEEARQTRLLLDRQVKKRKKEIKEQMVEDALARVARELESQSGEFYRVNWDPFLERSRFEQALKGKKSGSKAETAVAKVRHQVIEEIERKVAKVEAAVRRLEQVLPEYQPLFQDRDSLLDLSEYELEAEIEKRIRVADSTSSDQGSEEVAAPEAVGQPARQPVESSEVVRAVDLDTPRFCPQLVWESEAAIAGAAEAPVTHRIVVEVQTAWGLAERFGEKIACEAPRFSETWRVVLDELPSSDDV